MMTNWDTLAQNVMNGYELTNEEALSILQSHDQNILQLLNGAYGIRNKHFRN